MDFNFGRMHDAAVEEPMAAGFLAPFNFGEMLGTDGFDAESRRCRQTAPAGVKDEIAKSLNLPDDPLAGRAAPPPQQRRSGQRQAGRRKRTLTSMLTRWHADWIFSCRCGEIVDCGGAAMKLIDALANLNESDRLSDGSRTRTAGDLISQVAAADDSEYELLYRRDGRMALYRTDSRGIRSTRPAYVEVSTVV